MKKFEKINTSKFQSLETEQINTIKGGLAAGGGCTLNTVTVYSSGTVKDDGDDSYKGECSALMTADSIY